MGRHFAGWQSRSEDGDDSELETAPRRRNCAHDCHRAGLDHGGDIRSGRSRTVVGGSGRGWRHRRIDRFDNRQEARPPGRGQHRRGAGNPLRRSVHHPSSPRGMVSPPVAPSTPVAGPAGSPAALVRASSAVPSTPVAPAGFTSGPGTCFLNGTINASGTASGFMSSPGTCILNGTSIARGTASGFMSSPGTCILNGTSIVMTTDGSGRAPTPRSRRTGDRGTQSVSQPRTVATPSGNAAATKAVCRRPLCAGARAATGASSPDRAGSAYSG